MLSVEADSYFRFEEAKVGFAKRTRSLVVERYLHTVEVPCSNHGGSISDILLMKRFLRDFPPRTYVIYFLHFRNI